MQQRTLILCFAAFCVMCDNTERRKSIDYEKLKKHVQDSTDDFDLGFFEKRHVALVFKFNTSIQDTLDSNSLQIRRGPMPRMRVGGTFEVIYKDSLNNELGRYTMEDPMYRRREFGADKGWKKMDSGFFYVPLPRDSKIFTVHLNQQDKSILTQSKVGFLFKKLK